MPDPLPCYKKPLNQALVSFALVSAYVSRFFAWLLVAVTSFVSNSQVIG